MPQTLPDIEQALEIDYSAASLHAVHHPLLQSADVELYIKRDDLLHPVISGNKWRKLKYSLLEAINQGHQHLISMGGAWSNHLHALAYVGYQLNIKTTGLIRGEQPELESPTLQDLRDWGMHIEFVDRTAFRKLRQFRLGDDEPAQTYQGYWLPEGGATPLAMKGVGEIKAEIDTEFDTLCVACGTGCTLAGLIPTDSDTHRVIGIAALKGEAFLEKEIASLLESVGHTNQGWSINYDYHCGGFAKTSAPLLEFINLFTQHSDIPLEPVYTGKLLYGVFDLIGRKSIQSGEKIIVIHSGGLQGNRSIA